MCPTRRHRSVATMRQPSSAPLRRRRLHGGGGAGCAHHRARRGRRVRRELPRHGRHRPQDRRQVDDIALHRHRLARDLRRRELDSRWRDADAGRARTRLRLLSELLVSQNAKGHFKGTQLSGPRLRRRGRRPSPRTSRASSNSDRASGTVKVKVAVIDKATGVAVTNCRVTQNWNASHAPGTVYGGTTSQGAPIVLRLLGTRKRISDVYLSGRTVHPERLLLGSRVPGQSTSSPTGRSATRSATSSRSRTAAARLRLHVHRQAEQDRRQGTAAAQDRRDRCGRRRGVLVRFRRRDLEGGVDLYSAAGDPGGIARREELASTALARHWQDLGAL